MADYYFPEVNTDGQFTDPKVIADIQAKAKSSIDAVVPPNGTEGHALVKTSTGTKWGSVESPYELRGTGFPEGKVTANPGTYYTDTDVTNGAWRWFKKTGTGNTGWVVQDGDTGWRDISGSVEWVGSNAVGTFHLRRTNNNVHIRWVGVAVDKATTGYNTVTVCRWTIPGFEILDNTGGHPFNTSGVAVGYSTYGLGEPLNYLGFMREGAKVHVRAYNPPLDSRRSGYHVWPNFGPWPSTLPGTAA